MVLCLFKRTFIDYSSENCLKRLCNIHKAEVGGVGSVDGAGVLIGPSEDLLAIDEVNVLVAAIDSVVVGVYNDSSASYGIFISAFAVRVKVGA